MTSTDCCEKSTSIVIAVSLLALQSCYFIVNISGKVQQRRFVISIVFKWRFCHISHHNWWFIIVINIIMVIVRLSMEDSTKAVVKLSPTHSPPTLPRSSLQLSSSTTNWPFSTSASSSNKQYLSLRWLTRRSPVYRKVHEQDFSGIFFMIYHRQYHRYRRYHQNPHHYPHRLCYQHCAGLWRVPHGLSVKLSAAQEVESGCVSRLHWLPTFHHLPHPFPHHHILIIAILHLSRVLFSNQIWKVVTVILPNATHSKRNSYCWIFGNSKQVIRSHT